jgi:FAD/FMN-containing dehydrogenase
MTHAVDGYSLAMEFGVSRREDRRKALWEHCQRMADVVLSAGGRFYYAKDSILRSSSLSRIHGDDALTRFRAMKSRLDPGNLLQTDLSRRLGL